jgi:hypothetical protein
VLALVVVKKLLLASASSQALDVGQSIARTSKFISQTKFTNKLSLSRYVLLAQKASTTSSLVLMVAESLAKQAHFVSE